MLNPSSTLHISLSNGGLKVDLSLPKGAKVKVEGETSNSILDLSLDGDRIGLRYVDRDFDFSAVGSDSSWKSDHSHEQ